MKTLIVGFILLMAPVLSQALTPQQYCEFIEAKSSNSVEILNVDSGQVKMCYKGRFCVGQRRGSFLFTQNIRDIVEMVDGVESRGEGSSSVVRGKSPFMLETSSTVIVCN